MPRGEAGPRAQSLPEFTIGQGNYRDTGCEVAPACLACPLPVCRYDVPGGLRVLLRPDRDEAIARDHEAGMGIETLIERHRVSRRTVWRALGTP